MTPGLGLIGRVGFGPDLGLRFTVLGSLLFDFAFQLVVDHFTRGIKNLIDFVKQPKHGVFSVSLDRPSIELIAYKNKGFSLIALSI
jgi:hypothetical protein